MRTIKNDTEYYAITARIDALLEIVSDENFETAPEAIELTFLSELVEEYEKKYFPISTPTLAEVLKLRMFELNLNQVQLAELLGVAPARITEYLSGKEPTLKIARSICEVLGISATTALGVNTNENKQYNPVSIAI